MGIKVDNSFVVPAPADAAFKTLTDLPRVVPCMPGTELLEVLPGDRFRAMAKLRVGPVELQFKGDGELLERNNIARTSRLRAKGSDTKGRGSFLTEITVAVEPQDNAARVQVATDLTLTGAVGQYARGAAIVNEITSQLAEQFAVNLAALLMAEQVVQAARESARATITTREAVGAGGQPMPAGKAPLPRARTTPRSRPGPVREVARPGAATPLSGIRFFWNLLKATLHRWFGARR